MIWFKIFLVFLSCFLFRGIWARLFNSFLRFKVPSGPALKVLAICSLQQIMQPTLDQALMLPWIQMRARENSKWVWLIKLGLSSLSGLLLLAIIWYWIYFLGLRGTFIELNLIQGLSDPPEWTLWLGESSLVHLFVIAGFGFWTALALRRPFFAVGCVGVFLFTGLLSIPGGVAALLGERLGLKVLFRWRYRSEMLHREMDWSLILSAVILVSACLWGRTLVEVAGSFGFPNSFQPGERFSLLTVTLLLWSLIEVLLSMAFYHFYWIKYQSNDR